MEGYKNVLIDGLPDEEGSYLVILKDEHPTPHLFVRYANEDGSGRWISLQNQVIDEERIALYKRILVAPESKERKVLW